MAVTTLESIKRYFSLIWQLTITSFKLRNEGSYLGVLWYLLNPLLMFFVLYFIFSSKFGSDIEFYGLYLLLGLIQWNFFNLASSTSMRNIIQNSALIKSLNFKREALIISGVLMALITHFFELIVFVIFLLYFGINPILAIFFPIVLLLQFLFTLGIGFALSSWFVYFRDLDNIWIFVSRIWWFLTPIFYSSSGEGLLYTVNLLNPMYYFIDVSRDLLIYARIPEYSSLVILSLFSINSFILGYLIFTKLKNKFAELL